MSHMPTSLAPTIYETSVTVTSGSGAPVAAATVGTLYINTDNGDLYRYTGSVWSLLANLRGPQGVAGSGGGGGGRTLDFTAPPTGSGLTAIDRTGATDVKAGVKAALEWGIDNGYTRFLFPAGNYLLKRWTTAGTQPYTAISSIDIDAREGLTAIEISGEGAATRLVGDPTDLSSSDWHLIRIREGVKDVTVRNLVIDGSYTGPVDFPGVTEQHHLIRIGATQFPQSTYAKRIKVKDCYLLHCRGDAINVVGTSVAKATLTCTVQPANDETVTIGARTYTFKTTLTGAADEVARGANLTESLANLRRAVLDIGTEGTHYGTGTLIHDQIGAGTATSTTLELIADVPDTISVSETLANGSWNAATFTKSTALTDEVSIEDNFIFDTHRTAVGIQRGCRKVIISRNFMWPTRRGVIDFEPTGSNIDEPDGGLEGESPQQFIITNNVLVRGNKNNTVATLFGMGSLDRNDYSIFADNLCVNGGVDALSVGPIIIANNVIRGNTIEGGDPVGLIKLWRVRDVLISGNYIERPVPLEGADATGTLFFAADETSIPVNPANDETCTIGSKTYRFRTTLAAANDVLIGATLKLTCDNLVHAVLDDSGEGTLYGTGTTANSAITGISSDGESISLRGPSSSTATTETMANGFFENGASLRSSAGPCIEIIESSSIAPIRITIVGNHIRQHMPQSAISMTSASYVSIKDNVLYNFHSTAGTGSGIVHTSSSASTHVHIHDNEIYDLGTGSWQTGVRFATPANLAISSVVDNTIDGCDTGVHYVAAAPTVSPRIMGNGIYNFSSAAITLSGIPYVAAGNVGAWAYFVGSGAPSHTAAKGSLYNRTDGTAGSGGTAGTLRYLNTDGATTWVALIDA